MKAGFGGAGSNDAGDHVDDEGQEECQPRVGRRRRLTGVISAREALEVDLALFSAAF